MVQMPISGNLIMNLVSTHIVELSMSLIIFSFCVYVLRLAIRRAIKATYGFSDYSIVSVLTIYLLFDFCMIVMLSMLALYEDNISSLGFLYEMKITSMYMTYLLSLFTGMILFLLSIRLVSGIALFIGNI